MYIDMTYRGRAAKLAARKLLDQLTRIDQLPDNCRRAFAEERIMRVTTQEQKEFTVSVETGKKAPSSKVPAIFIEIEMEQVVDNPAFFLELYRFIYAHIRNSLQREIALNEAALLEFCFCAPHGQRLEGNVQIAPS